MSTRQIVSWNVNGIRAAVRNGFLEWLENNDNAIVCLQEIKARKEQIKGLFEFPDKYEVVWNPAQRAGYSGVATLSRIKPIETVLGLGIEEFDAEGRVILQEYEKFYLYNINFPNGQKDDERLDFKMRFYDVFLEHIEEKRKKGKAVIVCGDFNTAHKEIDLKNPKANEKTSGFLPIERAWIDKFIAHGYKDTFRMFNQDGDNYSWWTYRFGARGRNVGWRIDYFFIDEEHAHMVKDAFIQSDVMGSDHCPIGIELEA